MAPTMAAPTISGGWARAYALTSRSRARGSSLPPVKRADVTIGVLMKPGQMAVTPTPAGAQLARRHCESWRTAALVAA